MTTDARITELLARWDLLRSEGRAPSLEEFCRDCPELADELRRRADDSARRTGNILETVAEPPNAAPRAPQPPAAGHPRYPVVPGYEFLAELGRGGMGVVYKARQTNLNRPVAIKMILTGAQAGARERARFYAEAEAVAQLQHPNIVQIYDIGEYGDAPYFSMEFVDGPSLHRKIQGQPADATAAALLIESLARAIQYAHDRGIVHRDLKPANILLTESQSGALRECTAKLTDFGLARQIATDVRLTQTGVVLGTPCYMAPEQVENPLADIAPTVDVYGLGALLYELLTGRPPFSANSNFETMRQVVTENPLRPADLRPSVPPALERICLKCLAKRPEDRYATAQALADDLLRFLDGEHPSALLDRPSGARLRFRQPRPAPERRFGMSRRTFHGGLIGLALLLVAGSVAGFSHWMHRKQPSESAAAAIVPPFADLPPIKVGILHSLTGTMAISEAAVVDTTLLAIDEINEQGGLLGRKVEPVIRDGRSDPATFAHEAERLIKEDHVSAIFGCWTSACRKSVLPVVEANDNLLVYSVEYEGLEQSNHILYVGAAPNQQIIPAVKWCFAFLERRRFYLVGSDYIFPRAANEIIKDELKAMGGSVVGESYASLGTTDFTAIARRIAEARPDVILNTINGDSNIAFHRALRVAGIKPADVPVVSFSMGEQELRSARLADVVGDYAVRNYFQSTENKENEHFLDRFWARYGRQRVVGDAMESAYVGVNLWAQAVRAAGTETTDRVRESLLGQEFRGPGGRLRVDSQMLNTHRTMRIGRIEADGQFEIVASSSSPIAPVIFPKSRSREQWQAFLDAQFQKWGGQWSGPVDD